MVNLCYLKNSFKVFFLLSGLTFLSGCFDFGKKDTKKPDLLVINVLDKESYDDCHIPGSIQVDMMKVKDYVVPYPKTTQIVVYCSNYACTASTYVVKKLKKDGFEHVWDYAAGMAGWYKDKFPVTGPAKAEYLELPNPVLEAHPEGVDVISTEDLKKLLEAHELSK
ncbi:rhodanese-like domain-containing protein [Candidatus Babeliales bacterium]|nr:rhodanese-like domain-containing protein [Candidatus Babeliales bacterium]